MRAKRAGPTYVAALWRPFLLRIDHVFVPRDWCSAAPERFTLHGSDHRGVAVDVGPCPVL
jgi:endonuclease/exonuclease/phosphatase (EEP) superfamily protein YafD